MSSHPSDGYPTKRVEVVLVDDSGAENGLMERHEAHTSPGRLHRAVSVIGFDSAFERILLQRRAAGKTLFAGYWGNSACTHPFQGEDAVTAAVRRCRQELGATLERPVCVGSFIYRATQEGSDLVEYEFDHVVVGVLSTSVRPDPREVADTRWVSFLQMLTGDHVAAAATPLVPWVATACTVAASWLDSLSSSDRNASPQ